tara:strand:+ start:697 stop:1017 length:321 start_codon:yes stop_codon:yes gene_type:complete
MTRVRSTIQRDTSGSSPDGYLLWLSTYYGLREVGHGQQLPHLVRVRVEVRARARVRVRVRVRARIRVRVRAQLPHQLVARAVAEATLPQGARLVGRGKEMHARGRE